MTQETTMGAADITASGPCDGMGNPDPAGSYVQVRIGTRGSETFHRISRGAAWVLVAELQGVLTQCPKGCPHGECHHIMECPCHG